MSAKVYSERLGAISDDQFATAAARLDLGAFVSAAPISSGLFGQNVYVTTTAGDFVLRGAPHWVRGPNDPDYRREDRHQFTKEAFFAGQLHGHTRAPVAWPYLHDPTSDIFGWPYLVMPRMPGVCFNERSIREALAPEDRRDVAAALGDTLAEMQTLAAPFAGDFDVDTIALTAEPEGDAGYRIASVRRFAADAAANGGMTAGDMDWIDEIARAARSLPERRTTFVHGDYKLDNLTLVQAPEGWRVGGVFDLHTARFGDGAYDLARVACAYLDSEPDLARVFIDAWRAGVREAADPSPWMPLYLASERLAIWEFFARKRPASGHARTFRAFAEPYLSRLLALF